MSLKIGDIVQLKSGGPNMTVVVITSKTNVFCSWFAGAKHERANFNVDALQTPPTDGKK